jgi:hypothetical protein
MFARCGLGSCSRVKRRARIVISGERSPSHLHGQGRTSSLFLSYDLHPSVGRFHHLDRPQTYARNRSGGIRVNLSHVSTLNCVPALSSRSTLRSALLVARKPRHLYAPRFLLPPSRSALDNINFYSTHIHNKTRPWCPNEYCPSGRTRCWSRSSPQQVSA